MCKVWNFRRHCCEDLHRGGRLVRGQLHRRGVDGLQVHADFTFHVMYAKYSIYTFRTSRFNISTCADSIEKQPQFILLVIIDNV